MYGPCDLVQYCSVFVRGKKVKIAVTLQNRLKTKADHSNYHFPVQMAALVFYVRHQLGDGYIANHTQTRHSTSMGSCVKILSTTQLAGWVKRF